MEVKKVFVPVVLEEGAKASMQMFIDGNWCKLVETEGVVLSKEDAQKIKERYSETKMQFEECELWYKGAYEKYCKDRKYYGEADSGEYLVASDELAKLKSELTALDFVLQILNK